MILSELCCLFLPVLAPTATPVLVTAGAVCSEPQGGDAIGGSRGPSRSPSGGTPEPVTMLLVAGSILSYGALRLRGRKGVSPAAGEDKA